MTLLNALILCHSKALGISIPITLMHRSRIAHQHNCSTATKITLMLTKQLCVQITQNQRNVTMMFASEHVRTPCSVPSSNRRSVLSPHQLKLTHQGVANFVRKCPMLLLVSTSLRRSLATPIFLTEENQRASL